MESPNYSRVNEIKRSDSELKGRWKKYILVQTSSSRQGHMMSSYKPRPLTSHTSSGGFADIEFHVNEL